MPKHIINKFTGLGDSDRNLPEGQFSVGNGIDLYRDYKEYLAPAYTKTDIELTGQGEDIIDMVLDPIGQYLYLFTNGAKVYGISYTNNAVLNLGGGSTKAATFTGLSQGKGITMPSGADSNADRIYFFYNAATGDIAKGVPNTTDWSAGNLDRDWGSTTPTGSGNLQSNIGRRDCIEYNSLIYFTNDRYIGKLNTTTNPETLTLLAFDLGVTWSSDRLFKTDNFIGIFASKTQNVTGLTYPQTSRATRECRLYLWNGSSTNAYKIIPLPGISQVHACINKNGNIFAFVDGGTGGHYWTQLVSSGSNYYLEKIRKLQVDLTGSQIRDLLSPNSNSALEQYKDNVLLGTYTYGQVLSIGIDGGQLRFNNPYSPATAATARVTAVKQTTTDKIYVGYYNGTNYKFAVYNTGNTTSIYKGGYIDFGQKIKINYIKFYFRPLVTSDSITCGLDIDYGTAVTLGKGTGNVSYSVDGAITSKKFMCGKHCHAFRPTITWGAGGVAISKIVIDYQFIAD